MGLFFRASFLCFTAACHVTCVFIHTPPSNVTALEGDEVTLPCGTSRQKKGELVIWKKVGGIQEQVASINNRTTNSEKYYIRGTYDLVIREVSASDDGLYKCEAETNRATAYLSVSVPMQTLTLSSDVDFPLPSDSDVKLTCLSRHSHPPADIRWFRGQRELTNVKSVTSKIFQNDGYGDCESTITVHMRTGDDDIPFRCVADLPAKISVREAFLFPIVTNAAARGRGVKVMDMFLLLTVTCLLLLAH